MNAVLQGLKGLGAARLMALGVVGAFMFAMLGLLMLRGGSGGDSSHMALLYGDLELREAGEIVDQLDHAHIPHQEQGSGERILVPEGDVARARLLLAKSGLPSGGSIGYEIFDRGDSLTTTQFQQDINQTRAMEGELARSIQMLSGVRAARVHLVLPHRQPFSHDEQNAQASVLLTMNGAARLDTQAVQAVLNLVAAATPGLRAENIAIIDSRGTLLARAGQPTGQDAAATTDDDIRRTTEARLSHAVEEMLEQSVGPGHVRAEAAVEMNFEQVHETNESYNPDQQVVRSTEASNETSKSTEAEKGVSVANNLPNADAGQANTGTQSQHTDETTNYEIGKTVRTLVREQPQIARISLAVMVDGATAADAAGKPVWHERSAEDMARITRLVRSAIGYDEKRGDKVEVVSMPFAQQQLLGMDPAPPGGRLALLGIPIEKSDLIGLAQTGVLGLVVLLALLLVLRPMALRLSAAGGGGAPAIGVRVNPAIAGPGTVGATGAMMALAHDAGDGRGGSGGGRSAVPLLTHDPGAGLDGMIHVANVEGQLRSSSIRRLGELVQKHPEESLAIMRGWISQEGS